MIDCDRCGDWMCMGCSRLESRAIMDRVSAFTKAYKGAMFACENCEKEDREGCNRFIKLREDLDEVQRVREEGVSKLESQVRVNEE